MAVQITFQQYFTFQQYSANGLHLNGQLGFYDDYHSRTTCSFSGCASATDKLISYTSSGVNRDTLPPLTIAFKNTAGKPYKDNILLFVSKEYSRWEGKLINVRNQTISIYH